MREGKNVSNTVHLCRDMKDNEVGKSDAQEMRYFEVQVFMMMTSLE